MTKGQKDKILSELRQAENLISLLLASVTPQYRAYASNAKESVARAIREVQASKVQPEKQS